jgi:hypothetical protein
LTANQRSVTWAAELWSDGSWMFAQPSGRPIDPRDDYEA